MNEQEWRDSTSPLTMLDAVASERCRPHLPRRLKTSARKLRLAAHSCCRAAHEQGAQPQAGHAADAYEASLGDDGEDDTREPFLSYGPERMRFPVYRAVSAAVYYGAPGEVCADVIRDVFGWVHERYARPDGPCPLCTEVWLPYGPEGCALTCRCGHVFGHFKLSWLSADVMAMSRAAYAGDWVVLPVMADALEDAGCTDREVLAHCRGLDTRIIHDPVSRPMPATHVRGCWLTDLILENG